MQIKEVTEQLRDIDRDIEITKSKIETQQQYLQDTGKQNTKVIDDYKDKIKENKTAIDKYTTHIEGINKKIADVKSTILDEDKVREQVKKLNSFETQFESKVKECTKHKKFYEINDNCPTCKQSIDPQFKSEKIADNNKEIIKFNQALEDVAKEIGVHKDVVDDLVTFYYSEVRKSLSNITHNKITVSNLGTFSLRKNKLIKAIKRQKDILGNLEKMTFDGYDKSVPIKEKIMTRKRFSTAVEVMVSTHNMSYIDAATYIVQERGLDFRNLKRLLTDSLKQKLEEEASSLHLIRGKKKGNKLPV